MDSLRLSKLDNLLSRIDEKNKIVFLKKDEELERITFQNLFEGINFFQLCLRSQKEVVFLNLHAVLELSPLVAKLVEDLRHCCLSPHDQVDICLDQFPPHLLNIFKDLLEKGECTLQSRDEEKQLETLILAMGMDSSLELYRHIRVEKPAMSIKSRKRKSSGDNDNNLREFKLRQCLDCNQPFSASQSHICLISLDINVEDGQHDLDKNVEDGRDELDKNVEDGQDKKGMAVEIASPARETNFNKDIDESNFEDEQQEFKQNEYDSEDMTCPRCGKVYKKGGANKVYFKRHMQSCLKRKYNHNEKIRIDKNENQVDKADSHTEINKQKRKTAAKSRESTLYQYVPRLKSKKEPTIEKESKDCPFCGKRYVLKGRGANRALAMYDLHVSKCDGGDYDISCVDPDGGDDDISCVDPDEIIKDNGCNKCGKVFNGSAQAYHLKKHMEKCNVEFKECDKCGQNCTGGCKECGKCGKVFKENAPVYHFQKHIQYCNGECDKCGKVFKVNAPISHIKKHIQYCKGGECNECDKCGKVFKVNTPVYHFQKHIQNCKGEKFIQDQIERTVDSNSVDIMQCEECKSIFVGYEAFSNHKQNCLKYQEKYPCRYGCGKEFANKKLLKIHSWKWNCPVLNVSECQNMLCQLCGEGEFNEDDLYLHLFNSHEELRRQIQKEVTKKIVRFYFLEKEKMNCVCPICGEEMRASRYSFGKHWAVQHKQIKKFYLPNSEDNMHNNDVECVDNESEIEYIDNESEHGDNDKIEIEDYEEDVGNDQEIIKNQETGEGFTSQKTKNSSCISSNKLDNLAEEPQLFEENSKIQDMEENDPQNIKSLPKMIIRNGWQIEMLPKKASATRESGIEAREVFSEKLPTSIGNKGPPNIVGQVLRIENDFQAKSLTTHESRIEERSTISGKLPTSVEYESPLKIVGAVQVLENESPSTLKTRIEEKDSISEKSPTLSQLESSPQIIITNVREIENEKFQNQPSITDEFEIQKEHEPSVSDQSSITHQFGNDETENEIKKQSSITHESGIKGVKLISDSRLENVNIDDTTGSDEGEGREDGNDKRSIRNELLSESESDN